MKSHDEERSSSGDFDCHQGGPWQKLGPPDSNSLIRVTGSQLSILHVSEYSIVFRWVWTSRIFSFDSVHGTSFDSVLGFSSVNDCALSL